MKKISILIISLFLLLPSVNAVSYQSYGVTQQEQQLIEEEKDTNRSIFEELRYRFVEKDTHDICDYTLVSIIIILMFIIIVSLNKKTYITLVEESVFEKES